MVKFLKILVAGAMVLGVSTAMAGQCDKVGSYLGLQDDNVTCCLYDGRGDLVNGFLMDINITDGDNNITMKCGYDGKVSRPDGNTALYNMIRDDGNHRIKDVQCMTIIEATVDYHGDGENDDEYTIDTKDYTVYWQNIVSKSGKTSLVCKNFEEAEEETEE